MRNERYVPAGSQVDIDTRSERGADVVSIRGALGPSAVPVLERELALTALDDYGLVIDLSGCEFIDSAGLQVLMRRSRVPRRLGLAAVAAPAGSPARRTFELTGLSRALPTFDCLDDAIARVKGAYEWRHAPVA